MPTKMFPNAVNTELAGIEVESAKDIMGLKEAAYLDVGTASDEVAAGDHNHDGRYYTESEIDTQMLAKATTSALSSEASARSSGDATNAADLATEIIARANADIALANAKMNKPGGTSAQYIRGDETLATFPTIPNAQVQADYTQANSAAIDFIKNKPAAISVTSGVSRTIQTVAAAANGVQISSSRNALVSYSVSIQVTATIGGAASGAVVLEICPTNSATAGDWVTVNRTASSQAITLAVVLQSVQGATNTICGIVPAGYYSRLRSINVSGTPVYGYVSGQEVLL